MISEHVFHYLFQQLNTNTTVLTPNRRLAATLHLFYQQQQVTQHFCWPTPDILPITTWIERLWSDYGSKEFTDAPLILNTAQEQFLWESIIATTNDNMHLLQVPETAEMAKSAWKLLKQWQVDKNHSIFNSAEACTALHGWATAFEKKCQKNNWQENACLTDNILRKIRDKKIIPEKRILLVGFTELTPQLKQLMSHYDMENISLSAQASAFRIHLKDPEEELLTMARWAKTIFTQNKSARIGCVIPSLEKIRDRVIQIFSEIFEEKCFNISAGKPLFQCPIIYTALQLLSLHKKSMPLTSFSSLLMSPFVGNAEFERINRANFDSQLRRENMTRIHLMFDLCKSNCPHLVKRLEGFFTKLDESPKEQTYSKWAHLFNELLSVLGWPGERSLSSEEYQMVEHWLRLLEEFTTLDQVTNPAPIYHALAILQKMAAKAIFQPKTPEAPIQILGMLEAAGLPFDYLWVTGMDDMSWPPQPKPNPLIPKRLQRELHMPHATAERELIYCQQLIQQFKHSTTNIIFSHPEKNNELELQASSLIRNIPEISINQLQLENYQSFAEKIFQSKVVDIFTDEIAPTYSHNENTIRGGISVVKQQALCPFKAFAEWRLYARELESPLPGLRAKDRGSVLHKVLEILWNNLEDQATLCKTNTEELNHIIAECINQALNFFPHFYIDKKQYSSLEKLRLHQLLWGWLEIEKKRPPFKVLHSEKIVSLPLHYLKLTMRIDRIDELEDGKKLIIDYKTGKNNDTSHWFGDRPEEPQLPLYALLDKDIVGIAYAQIAPGKNCFKGMSHYPLNIRGIDALQDFKKADAATWEDQVSHWNTTLTTLSDDFYNGKAQIDPKALPGTCKWCNLKSLCRIKELPIPYTLEEHTLL
jgi:ATP-dependent helicase/nuclease subunit B